MRSYTVAWTASIEGMPVINRITDREPTIAPTAAAAGNGGVVRLSGLIGLLLSDRGLRLNSP